MLPDTQNGDAATRWVSTSQPAPGSPFSNGARRRQGPPLRSGPGERPTAALDPVSAPQEFAMREQVASPPIVSQRWSSRVAVNTQRLTQTELAIATGVSAGTVARALDFYEMPRHPPKRGRTRTGPNPPHPHTGRPGGIDERWLRDQLVRRHRLDHDIAAECGVTTTLCGALGPDAQCGASRPQSPVGSEVAGKSTPTMQGSVSGWG